MSGKTTIFAARKVITFDPSVAEATHVAVRDGLIVEIGDLDDCRAWGDHVVEDRFADSIIMPGMIESHAHMLDGMLWSKAAYVGPIDRTDPEGRVHKGIRTDSDLLARLKQVEATLPDATTPLLCWGVDPALSEPTKPITRHDLDQVSTTRLIFVLHDSCHIAYVNSATLRKANYAAIRTPGVTRDAAGEPTGELLELAAMVAAVQAVGLGLLGGLADPRDFRNFARVAQARGVTTIVDGGSSIFDPAFLKVALETTSAADFPVRIVAHHNGITIPRTEDILRLAASLEGQGNDKLVFQAVKIVLDGSNQGGTARLRPPAYLGTGSNGIWNRSPEEIRELVPALHAAGLQIAAHCNADQAAELFIDAVHLAQERKPRFDHRHFIVHGQLLDESLIRRMVSLGIHVTFFPIHLYYWGEFHRARTFGAFRAAAMNPAATALRLGLVAAAHSDAPVSPVDPLLTAWCTANRVTAAGRTLGADERVSAYDALRMMTFNAAYILHRDHEVGSLRVGKRADFAILGADPLAGDPMTLRDIPVRGTVVGGDVFGERA